MKKELLGLASLLGFILGCRSQPPAAPAAAAPDGRERAIASGLAWLGRHQAADGGWRASAVDPGCNQAFGPGHGKDLWTDHFDVGSTALGALAFLRAGRRGPELERAIAWLHAQQNEQGFFGKERSFLYNEALATLALVEHYQATQAAAELEPAQRAVDFLVRAQRPSPAGTGAWGWRYQSRMEIEQRIGGKPAESNELRELYDSDVSITGWAAAALVQADRAGLKVDPAALKGASDFVHWCRARDGQVGYNDPRNAGLTVQGRDDHFDYHPSGMSAIALRVANEIDRNPGDSFVASAQALLAADQPRVSPNGLSIDYYYWLNGTLGLASTGDSKYLEPWIRSLHGALLGLQDPKAGSCGSGGWLVPDRWSYAAGPVYTTAMALLALEQKG